MGAHSRARAGYPPSIRFVLKLCAGDPSAFSQITCQPWLLVAGLSPGSHITGLPHSAAGLLSRSEAVTQIVGIFSVRKGRDLGQHHGDDRVQGCFGPEARSGCKLEPFLFLIWRPRRCSLTSTESSRQGCPLALKFHLRNSPTLRTSVL